MLPQVLMGPSALASAIIPNYTTSESGNPFIAGWYADPDADFFDSQYWVYPTASLPYDEQTYLDAFSSPDLVHWTKHPSILTTASVSWARRAVWAPCVVHRNGKYYLYFGANDIQPGDGQMGGIGVAISDHPNGPFADAIGKPLISDYHHGAQPIDQDVFVDDDGQAYIYYGGHSHAVMAKLNEDMVSLGAFEYDDGSTEIFRDITPPGYVEGAVVFKRQGWYYMMWSEGGWGGPDYAVAYGTADTPLGPFDRVAKIL
jgi:beta-xylosidase